MSPTRERPEILALLRGGPADGWQLGVGSDAVLWEQWVYRRSDDPPNADGRTFYDYKGHVSEESEQRERDRLERSQRHADRIYFGEAA